jgi:hypothetical protein
MYNKKGLSAIVATVLIILLVIAGVTLVWTPVRKLITDQSKELEASCLLANPTITKACRSGSDIDITISNGAEGKIDGTQVIYGDDANSLINSVVDNTTFNINQVKTITVTGATGTPAAVKIAAIVGTETCNAGSVSAIAATC